MLNVLQCKQDVILKIAFWINENTTFVIGKCDNCRTLKDVAGWADLDPGKVSGPSRDTQFTHTILIITQSLILKNRCGHSRSLQLALKLTVTNSCVNWVLFNPKARTSTWTKTDKPVQLWMNKQDTMRGWLKSWGNSFSKSAEEEQFDCVGQP